MQQQQQASQQQTQKPFVIIILREPKSKTVFIAKPEKLKTTIPKHTIVRVERLSGTFEQWQVYVTVDKSSSKESMQLLCKKLRDNYKEFSNIIICLYADNTAGNELASGSKLKFGTKEKNKAWLVMYSYNTVEGEYFDDNPGGYLGTY